MAAERTVPNPAQDPTITDEKCPVCSANMQWIHAEYRCIQCGYIAPCCEP